MELETDGQHEVVVRVVTTGKFGNRANRAGRWLNGMGTLTFRCGRFLPRVGAGDENVNCDMRASVAGALLMWFSMVR